MPQDSHVSPSVRLVEAIADVEGVDPIELDFVLSEVIDAEALDALVRHEGEPVAVEFTLGDHDVLVTDTVIHIDESVTVSLE